MKKKTDDGKKHTSEYKWQSRPWSEWQIKPSLKDNTYKEIVFDYIKDKYFKDDSDISWNRMSNLSNTFNNSLIS